MNRLRSFLAVALTATCVACASPNQPADFIITGGRVIAGDGSISGSSDVVIVGDRIVAIGPRARRDYDAATTIDATGKVVSPGFIDPHTHALSGLRALKPPQPLANYLTQGVTTLVIGNDGGGPADIAGQHQRIDQLSVGPNIATFVGHNAVREAVVGLDNRSPSAAELEQMRSLIDQAMQDGALGLSAGLYYPPGVYAQTAEVVALAQVAAGYGGLYESHIRDESSYTIGLLGAIDEALTIGRESGAAVHIAHIKALGVDVWGQSEAVIARIEAARSAGQVVTADQYPWQASGTRLRNALLSGWSRAGGNDALQARLTDATLRARIASDMKENLRRRGGADAILLTSGPHAGVTLEALAAQQSQSAINAALALIETGETRIASFNMNAEDIERFMVQPWVVTSSDGTVGHPRLYASFPQKYARYVREQQVISIEAFIQRSSADTAAILNLCDRGVLRPGAFADVIVFDAETFAPRADFRAPDRLSVGVNEMLINGRHVIADGELTGIYPGRAIRRDDCSPTDGRIVK
ncbi:MAG: amidohydrolase family protein [Pseudomonadota bacterium]